MALSAPRSMKLIVLLLSNGRILRVFPLLCAQIGALSTGPTALIDKSCSTYSKSLISISRSSPIPV
jgi:hypothetical protein